MIRLTCKTSVPFQHLPDQDRKRKQLLRRRNLVSDMDGLVSKEGGWRSSFSCSERNLIDLDPELYRALKYLNKVGGCCICWCTFSALC